MSKSALISRTWSGGVSVDNKIGTQNSFKRSRSINHRKKASQIDLHHKFVKESGTIVDTPVFDGIRTPDSSVYFAGDTKVYRRTVDTIGTPGTYSVFATDVTNVKSGIYNRDRKKLYLPGDKTIHAVDYASTAIAHNLIANPSFEHGTTPLSGWTTANATATADTTEHYVGAQSLKLVSSNGSAITAYTDVTAPIDTTKQYTIQLRIKGTATKTITVTGGATSGSAVALTGSWQQVTLTYTPSGSNYNRVSFSIQTGTTCYIDAVMLEQASSASTYFDGNDAASGSTTYRWDGDVNLSASTKMTTNTSPSFLANLVGQLKDYEVVNTGSNTYTLPTSISESATNKLTFTPDIEPYIKVGVYVVSKGTGDLICTLHDSANNVVATATLPNASMTNGAINYVTFSSQVRLSAQPNPYQYHFHFTTTTGTTTLRAATASDLSTADIVTYADCLVQDVYHPCGEFLQYVVIGNDNYVAVWEPITDAPLKSEFQPHRLKLPSEYRVLNFTEYKEYYVISAYKSVSSDYGDEFGSNSTEGLLGFWDGASRGFAWFVKVEGGAMESIFTSNGFIYGYVNGVLHVTSGDIPVPVYEVPGLVDFTSTHNHEADVYLQAPYKGMCVVDNVMMTAFPMKTANESITPGVYSFGKKTKDFAESIAFDHIPSHEELVPKFDADDIPRSGITYLGRFGKNTFMAWQSLDTDGDPVYGIDVHNKSNPYYDSGELSYLDIDNKITYKTKEAVEIVATYLDLPGDGDSAASIRPYYYINGETERQYGVAGDLTNDTEQKQYVLKVNKEYRVIEYGVELHATEDGTGTPVVDSTTIIVETNDKEGL